MKLEFGCGETPTHAGYKTCDIRDLPGIDYVCPATEIDRHCEPNSVTHITSRHMFEHLTFYDGERYLEACMRILRSGGELHMSLPNMDFHVQQWLNGSKLEHARAGFWGWQRETDTGQVWDVHKSGYNYTQLSALLASKGYVRTQSLRKPLHKHLEIKAYKP